MSKQILYLVKIGKRTHLDSTREKGQFFMNTCEAFRKMALEDGGDLVGDLQECSFPQGTEICIGGITMNPFDKEDPESSAMCCGANYCIYCAYSVFADRLPNEGVIPVNVFRGIVGKNDPLEYAVLLFKNPLAIIKKIVAALSVRGLVGRCDLVSYDDHDFISPYDFGSDGYILDLCFHKRHDFEGQNEYRIATINTENKAIDDLYIGRLNEKEYEILPIEMDKELHILTDVSGKDIRFRWE